MIVKPDQIKTVKKIFDKWELESVEIGRLTDNGRMKIYHNGKLECNLSISDVVDNSPEYDRPSKNYCKTKPTKINIKSKNIKRIL